MGRARSGSGLGIAGRTANLRLADVGLDLAKARVTTRDLLARIDAGEDPRVASRKVKATTLGGVAELYLKHSADEVGPRTQVERVRHLTRDWKPLHHRPIAEIKKGEVALRLLEIKDEHGPIAANRSRTTLFGLFNWALDQDLIEVNVVASTRRPLQGGAGRIAHTLAGGAPGDPERDRGRRRLQRDRAVVVVHRPARKRVGGMSGPSLNWTRRCGRCRPSA